MPVTLHAFFSVDSRVGRNGDNIPLDVMLIQYMLWHSLVQGTPHFNNIRAGFGGTLLPGQAGFAIGPKAIYPFNGEYQPELDQWIKFFQIACNAKGFGPLVEDGRIDPPRKYFGWGKRCVGSQTNWLTIQALNEILFRMCNSYYSNLPFFSDVPVELSTYLKRVALSHA